MNVLTETFIKYSESVSNKNLLLSFEEFSEALGKHNFDYVSLKTDALPEKIITAGNEGIGDALVEADFAIAETGSVVIESTDERLRKATCLAERLHVTVPASRIVPMLEDVADFLEEKSSDPASFTAFITGASRTADIERVLTIGVHGPCEMTVYIITDR